MIKTIAKPADKKVTGCGECRSTCQSACKTSCTVGNQSCERITREEKIERKYFSLTLWSEFRLHTKRMEDKNGVL